MRKNLQKLVLLLCLLGGYAYAQDRTVTGTVIAREDGLPMPGVSVIVKGSTKGTQTNAQGKFSLSAPSAAKIVFSFIGYSQQEFSVPANGVINVTLSADATSLNEVVVTAGGIETQRRALGNQATTVTGTSLTQGKPINVAAGLSGKVPGLQVNAVSSGVNPTYRLVLRGTRSISGNNQALVVVDNNIVPNAILGNLNPEDIEDIQVLNGAGAAALYGSDASNGALIITTKKGKKGSNTIKVSNTSTFESVSYLPKIQDKFGSGTTPDNVPSYTPYENQQYGPAYDGSMRVIGKPLVDGSIQTVQYSPTNSRDKFWETGLTNQTDFSVSSGDDRSTYYLTAQYLDQVSTVPTDYYNRFGLRANATRDLGNKFDIDVRANYIQNRYDGPSSTSGIYNNVLMTPGQVDVTKYSDWQNNPFANPNGYYNEYYDNPYFTAANSRGKTRNDYLNGSMELHYAPIKGLRFMYRIGLTTQNASSKSWTNKFTYTDYTKSISGSSKTDVAGGVSDGSSYSTQLVSEFQTTYKTKVTNDISFDGLVAAQVRDNNAKSVSVSSSGMVQPGLYNIGNTLNNPSASESNSRSRQQAVYGSVTLGYKDFLYLHATARNDWRSTLAKAQRSFFYPAADVSFIVSDVVPFLKNSDVVESIKLRGGISKVGNVTIGAYALSSTFSQSNGYPYSTGAGYTINASIVSPTLEPEITTGYEYGTDFDLFKGRLNGSVSYYKTSTKNQTLGINISGTSGYTSYLTNIGEVENTGIETALHVTPIKTASGIELTLGGNYTYATNKVVSLTDGLPQVNMSSGTGWRIVAEVGKAFPLLQETQYIRDDQGRVIVNAITGFPTAGSTYFDSGVTNPPHRLGLDVLFSFKRLRFTSLFEYRTGGQIFNSVSTGFDFSGAGIRTTYFNRDRFVVPNSSYWNGTAYVANTNITTRTGGADFWTAGPTNTSAGENYSVSSSFWKWREASLSYDIPGSVFGNIKFIKGATVSVNGRNLMMLVPKTNLYTDPEYSSNGSGSNAVGVVNLGNTPPARYYGATLSVTL